jgi:multiple sugar transport system ATP-binding protein
MRAELVKLHRELRSTIVYVTHDQVEAMTLGDRIVVLEAGRVRQVGTPLQLYHRPTNLFVAGFIGSPRMNFLKVEVTDAGPDGVVVQNIDLPPTLIPVRPGNISPGDAVILGIRPENLTLPGDAAVRIKGLVELVERLGRETGVRVTTGSGVPLDGVVDGAAAVVAQAPLVLGFSPKDCHVFDKEGQALERRAVPAMADAFRQGGHQG